MKLEESSLNIETWINLIYSKMRTITSIYCKNNVNDSFTNIYVFKLIIVVLLMHLWFYNTRATGKTPLTDPGGTRDAHFLSVQFLSFSCSFRPKFCQKIGFHSNIRDCPTAWEFLDPPLSLAHLSHLHNDQRKWDLDGRSVPTDLLINGNLVDSARNMNFWQQENEMSTWYRFSTAFLRWYEKLIRNCQVATISDHFYRPQRSLGKVIFSVACVKNSVHGGRGRVPVQVPPPAGTPTPQAGTPPWAGTPPAGTPTHPLGQVHPPGAVHAGRYGQQAGGTHTTRMHSCWGYLK